MRVLTGICLLLALMLASEVNAQNTPLAKVEVTYSEAQGIGVEKDVMRRDPSDIIKVDSTYYVCLLYTSPSPRDATLSRMPSSA